MLDQGEQEEKSHVIWETSIKGTRWQQEERHMLQTIQSPILAFKPPKPPGHKEQEDKGTNDQENQGNTMIREMRRKTRRKEQG